MIIRTTHPDDTPALQAVIDDAELFPSEMLPDLLSGFLSDPDSEDLWLTCEHDGAAVGFCYAVPEDLTDGTWNMLALAVTSSQRGRGAGRALVQRLEQDLRARGVRVLLADTSGTDAFAPTRAFYRGVGYAEEARIRDFWAAGDDKVTFWKALA